ncbi:MAG TPA: HAMP domain-containing sensor histidine kinase [Caulobacteraceae bacterium]
MTKSRSAMSFLDRLIDWFIPADIAAERESRQLARMFLISHLCGPFIGNVVPIGLLLLDPTPTWHIAVLAVSITSFWVFPFVLRAVGRYNLLAFVSIQNLIFCIFWSCYIAGGVTSPTLPWVLNIPLIAFFYLGPSPKLRAMVFALFAANLAGFFALYSWGPPVPHDVPLTSLQGLGIISTLGAAGYVTMMALYYAKILSSGVELETEMKGHLATAAELRRAAAEAERAGVAKTEFLAKMSHELRTPLNAVIGYSQMLLEDAQAEGDASSAKDLEKSHGAGHHLLRLVNEILDLSKIEAGKMELSAEEVEVSGFMTETVESYRTAAENNGNQLALELAPDLGRIVCDATKSRQAISQLLSNAAKFTKDGRITVSVERRRGREAEEIAVAVRDTGIGIPAEILPSLFEKFSVAEDASTSKYGGTGLGLALSLKLSRLMGGDLTVESRVGEGSCFTLVLPCTPPASAQRRKTPAEEEAEEAAVAAAAA